MALNGGHVLGHVHRSGAQSSVSPKARKWQVALELYSHHGRERGRFVPNNWFVAGCPVDRTRGDMVHVQSVLRSSGMVWRQGRASWRRGV